MRVTRVVLTAVALAAALCAAQGAVAPRQPAPKPRPAKLILPSWAPKKPSKEFLRAAKVLKPIPEEVQPYDPLYPATWEFFGGLDEKQTAAFLKWTQHSLPLATTPERNQRFWKENAGATKVGDKLVYRVHEIYLPFGSLTRRQRQLFEGIAKAWSSPGSPQPERQQDLLVVLYKAGAKKDLSNVLVGFDTAGHRVWFTWVVKVVKGDRNNELMHSEGVAYL